MSIKSIQDDVVTLVNPWNSEEIHKMSIQDFLKHVERVECLKFDNNTSCPDNHVIIEDTGEEVKKKTLREKFIDLLSPIINIFS